MEKFLFVDKGEESNIIEVNKSRLLVFALVILITILSLSFAGAKFFLDVLYDNKIAKIKQNNQNLVQNVNKAQEKINKINSQLSSLQKRDKALRTQMNLSLIDKDIQKLGTGGNIIEKSNAMNDLLPSDTLQISSLLNDLNQLERKIKLEKLSYDEIYDSFKKYSDRIKSTPSICPVSNYTYISDDYGYRRDPFTQERRFHPAIDFAASYNIPVMVTADGEVIDKRYSPSYGNVVKVEHGTGYVTLYAHLSEILVEEGEEVKRGQVIAEVGNTGRSTGPHLHYEVMKYEEKKNPAKYFFNGYLN